MITEAQANEVINETEIILYLASVLPQIQDETQKKIIENTIEYLTVEQHLFKEAYDKLKQAEVENNDADLANINYNLEMMHEGFTATIKDTREFVSKILTKSDSIQEDSESNLS